MNRIPTLSRFIAAATGRRVSRNPFAELRAALPLVDGRAAARGIVFTEHVMKIADQQAGNAVRHSRCPL